MSETTTARPGASGPADVDAGEPGTDEVTTPYRRLVAGLAASIRERGYPDTTVADIVRHARASRRTFYEHFPTKHDCLIALLQQLNDRQTAAIAQAIDPGGYPLDRVHQAIHAWLQTLRAEPEITLCWIRDLPTIGPQSRNLEREFGEGFIALIQHLTDTEELRQEGIERVSRERAIMLLGGLRQLIVNTVEDGGDIGAIERPAVEFTIACLGPPPQLPDAAQWRQRHPDRSR